MRKLLAVLATVALLVLPTPAYASESLDIKLRDVNHTGANGTASITVNDAGDLTVVITATGLAPNLPHPQHLHGSMGAMETHCPSTADKDGDGFISVEEGVPMYGDVFVSLTTTGDTTFTSALAVNRMPKADAQGNLSYRRTIAAADLPPDTAAHLKDLHIVQHGIDANHNGQYDLAGLGESSFARSLGVPNIPEEETDPATCGLPAAAAAADVPTGGVATGDGSNRLKPGTVYLVGGATIVLAMLIALTRRRPAVAPKPKRPAVAPNPRRPAK